MRAVSSFEKCQPERPRIHPRPCLPNPWGVGNASVAAVSTVRFGAPPPGTPPPPPVSTGARKQEDWRQSIPDVDNLDPLFEAAVDATEEAVLNALWHAETTTGREGRVAEALPHDDVLELLRTHGRLGR